VNRREFFRRGAIAGAAAAWAPYPFRTQATARAAPLESPSLVPEYFGQMNVGDESRLLRVGFAERDITPDVGMEFPGDYVPTYLTGFHDQCKVRAAVFDDGAMRVALIGTDSEQIPKGAVVDPARERIKELCSISPVAVMVGAAHNHSAGPIGDVEPGQYDHASALVQRLAYDESPAADPGYLKRVIEQIVSAVCEANENLVEAYCGVGTGIEDKVAFSRRFRMKNGLTYTHPGQGNPEIIGYEGAVDPQVGVIGAWDRGGRFLGCVVNFTCHATTNPGNGSEASANWIYYMERVIRGGMGAEVPVVFLQGAAGNVTQVDNLSPYAFPQNTPWAEFVGGRVGAEAVKVLLTMVPGSLTPLNAASKVLHIKPRTPSPGHVREAFELVKQNPDAVGRTNWVFAKEILMLDALLKEGIPGVEVQAIQVGPAVFVSNPAELFCQLGLNLKAKSHFPHTHVVSYANGYFGYVPTEEAFGPHGGGYETRVTSDSYLEMTAGTQMVKAGLELIAGMNPGRLPSPRKAPPFNRAGHGIGSSPWSYGDLPPQVD
jgi:neutral ceramidase